MQTCHGRVQMDTMTMPFKLIVLRKVVCHLTTEKISYLFNKIRQNLEVKYFILQNEFKQEKSLLLVNKQGIRYEKNIIVA